MSKKTISSGEKIMPARGETEIFILKKFTILMILTISGFVLSSCATSSKNENNSRVPAAETDGDISTPLSDAVKKEIQTKTPILNQSEIFIVFDDSGSMEPFITNAQKAVMSLLINTAATAKANEVPFVHFIPLNSRRRINAPYPYQHLIDYLKKGKPRAYGGTPFIESVNVVSWLISSRVAQLKKKNKHLKEAIVYIFTDGEPDSGYGNQQQWLEAVRSLLQMSGGSYFSQQKQKCYVNRGDSHPLCKPSSLEVQLTVLGDTMSYQLYESFQELQNQQMDHTNFVVHRLQNIEDIEMDTQALSERLLVNRLNSRIELAANLTNRTGELESLLDELNRLKSELSNIIESNSKKDIEKILHEAIEQFKKDQNQGTVQEIAEGFKKISGESSRLLNLKAELSKIEARALSLHQEFNESQDDLNDTKKTIDQMNEDQKARFSELITRYKEVEELFARLVGATDNTLISEIPSLIKLLTERMEKIEKSYKALFDNGSILIEFLATLPEDVRRKIESDMTLTKDIAIDYQNKVLVYVGVHFFRGTGQQSSASHQTDWTVVNKGTIVHLGGSSSSGGAVAKTFINEGVILHDVSPGSGRPGHGQTHLVNNGKIIRLTQKIKVRRPGDDESESSAPHYFHWQRVDENGETSFVIYDERDGSIYQVTWNFILNFKRGTTIGGKIYNFFAKLFYSAKAVNTLNNIQLEEIDELQGQEAKAYLQGLFPERLKVLRKTEDEWLALVPEKLVPVFEDILCIEMNGDLGFGKAALENESLKRELESKRKRQCGR